MKHWFHSPYATHFLKNIDTEYDYGVDYLKDASRLNLYGYDPDIRFPKNSLFDKLSEQVDVAQDLNELYKSENNEVIDELHILLREFGYSSLNDIKNNPNSSNQNNNYSIINVDEKDLIDVENLTLSGLSNIDKEKLDIFFENRDFIHHGDGGDFFGAKETTGQLRNFMMDVYLKYYRGSDSLDNFKNINNFNAYLEQFKITSTHQKKWNSLFTGCGVPILDRLILLGKDDDFSEIEEIEIEVEKYISEEYEQIETIIKENKTCIIDAPAGLGKTNLIKPLSKNHLL